MDELKGAAILEGRQLPQQLRATFGGLWEFQQLSLIGFEQCQAQWLLPETVPVQLEG